MSETKEDLSAGEAAALLGVKLPTLYAYVSRGLLRSDAGDHGRARRYRRSDVEALRSRRRRDAAGALRWGEPILETGLTEMTQEGPRYRGHLATDLARAGTRFERVAELLWTGVLPDEAPHWPAPEAAVHEALPSLLEPDASTHAVASLMVAALSARDAARHDLRIEAVLPRARRMIRGLAAALALPGAPHRAEASLRVEGVAEAVLVALGVVPSPAAVAAVDQCLVLLADHELNASTFAARVIASSQADLYAAVLGGLGSLSGPLHGSASDHVELLVREARDLASPEQVIRERDRRGERLPGFGHPFYDGADARAEVLFETCFDLAPDVPELRTLGALADAMAAAGRPAPNVDLALVALRAALGLPAGAALGFFVVGRAAGWTAHVLEQQRDGHLIRPRARYQAPSDALAADDPQS